MVRFAGQLDSKLDRLSELLDDEHECIVQMRYEELLNVLGKKKQIQASLAQVIDSMKHDEKMETSRNTVGLARQVEDKSKRNERLVRSSLRMVDEVLHLFYSHQPNAGQYDNKGLACVPCGNSTWHDSA